MIGLLLLRRKENSSAYKAQQVKMYIIEICIYFPSSGCAMLLTSLFLARENKFKS